MENKEWVEKIDKWRRYEQKDKDRFWSKLTKEILVIRR